MCFVPEGLEPNGVNTSFLFSSVKDVHVLLFGVQEHQGANGRGE